MATPQYNTMSTGLGNMDYLKSQILTMFALKGNNTEDGIFMAIWAIMLITMIDGFFRYLPILIGKVENMGKYIIKNRLENALPSVISSTIDKPEECSILLTRNYKTKDGKDKDNIIDYEFVDAIIEYICSLDNSKHLRYINKFYINNKDEIIINKDIKSKLETISIDNQNNEINGITIRLYSSSIKISTMKEQLNKIYTTYKIEKCNKLGTQRYFFDEVHIPPMPDIDGGYRFDTAPKRITFNMTPFNTYKSVNNIFGKHIDDVRERVNLFINHPEWYEKRGIPHTLGILLHGKPGCGKTSLIKAIAKDTNRHVFNITLRKTTTQRQLLNLFFDENVSITNSLNETSILAIPLEQRIYVIEDIDCMSTVVLDRKFLELMQAKKKGIHITNDELNKYLNPDDSDLNNLLNNSNEHQYFADNYNNNDSDNNNCRNVVDNIHSRENINNVSMNTLLNNNALYAEMFNVSSNINLNQNANKKKNKNINFNNKNKEELTLSFLLNLLDGVLETPNRILVMTSNYPKRLDKALVRPGRIDINIEFGCATNKMIEDMLCHFYNKTKEDIQKLNIPPELDNIFTPAEIIAILCNNYCNIDKAIIDMQNKMKINHTQQ
jgi:ATP-dependent Zn protease